MAVYVPDRPDRQPDIGILIALYGDPLFSIEIERAPDSGGTPGAWANIATVDPGTRMFFDAVADTNAAYWYRARHVGAGYDPGAYTTAVSSKPGPMPTKIDSTNNISLSLATPIAANLGGTGFDTYAVGDMLFASGAYSLARLAAGTAGYVLGLSAGSPAWVNPATYLSGSYVLKAGDTMSGQLTMTGGAVLVVSPATGSFAVAIPNNTAYGVYDSAGTVRSVLTMDNANPDVLVLRNNQRNAGGTISFRTAASGGQTAYLDSTGAFVAASLSGAGSGLTALNASNVSSGNLAYARLPTGAGTWDTAGGRLTLNSGLFRVELSGGVKLETHLVGADIWVSSRAASTLVETALYIGSKTSYGCSANAKGSLFFLRDDGVVGWLFSIPAAASSKSMQFQDAGGNTRMEWVYTAGDNGVTTRVRAGTLTSTDASPFFDVAGTWNTTGAPTALLLDVTNTASGAASLLMNLRVGGASKFKVDKAGSGVFAAGLTAVGAVLVGASTILDVGSAATPGVYFNGTLSGFYNSGAGEMVGVVANGAEVGRFDEGAATDDMGLWLLDYTAATLKRVSRGASDSGGTGYRLLRVAN